MLSLIPSGTDLAWQAAVAVICIVFLGILRAWSALVKQLNKESADSTSALFFEDPCSPQKLPLPSIYSEPCKHLSIIFPAYNEEARMQAALDEALEFLKLKRKADLSFSYEVIVVDDGSTDGTYLRAMKYVEKYGLDTFRAIRLPVNKGKGAAVRAGMLAARGELLLFADADGATQFSDVQRLHGRMAEVASSGKFANQPGTLLLSIADRHGLVVGSRAYLEETDVVAKRHWMRNAMMHGFHLLVQAVAGGAVRDTQCGFKLFTRRSARLLFKNMRLQRWCFDVELVYLANRFKIPIAEESVNWTEVAGSKIRMWHVLTMAFDLFLIKSAYQTGMWTAEAEEAAVP